MIEDRGLGGLINAVCHFREDKTAQGSHHCQHHTSQQQQGRDADQGVEVLGGAGRHVDQHLGTQRRGQHEQVDQKRSRQNLHQLPAEGLEEGAKPGPAEAIFLALRGTLDQQQLQRVGAGGEQLRQRQADRPQLGLQQAHAAIGFNTAQHRQVVPLGQHGWGGNPG